MSLHCKSSDKHLYLENGPLPRIRLQSCKRICIDSSLYSMNMREYFSTSLICNFACHVFYKSNPAVSDWCISISCHHHHPPSISILQRAVMAALTPWSPLSLMSDTMPACNAGTMWVKATLEGCDVQPCFHQRPVACPITNTPSGSLANSIGVTAHIMNARGETLITYEINPWFKFKRTSPSSAPEWITSESNGLRLKNCCIVHMGARWRSVTMRSNTRASC